MERIADLKERLNELKKENSKDIASVQLDLTYQKIILDNLKEISNSPTGKRLTETQGIRVGDAVFVSLPGEVLWNLDWTLRLSRRFHILLLSDMPMTILAMFPRRKLS